MMKLQEETVVVQINPRNNQEYSKFIIDNNLERKEKFTTNIDYVGHFKNTNVAVYLNAKIKKGEIKEIMANEFKQLKPGMYDCMVRQVISKNGKTNGQEDESKKIVVLELDVKGQNDYAYMTFFLEGYSDKQLEISQDQIRTLCETFGVNVIEEMVNVEASLKVKQNGEFTNMYLNPKKKYFDWNDVFKFDGQASFPCRIKKFYKTNKGEKYNVVVSVDIDANHQDVTEFVNYDLENEFRNEAFEFLLKKLNTNVDHQDEDLGDVPAKLVVKRVTKGDIHFINKRIAFDKVEKQHYWK